MGRMAKEELRVAGGLQREQLKLDGASERDLAKFDHQYKVLEKRVDVQMQIAREANDTKWRIALLQDNEKRNRMASILGRGKENDTYRHRISAITNRILSMERQKASAEKSGNQSLATQYENMIFELTGQYGVLLEHLNRGLVAPGEAADMFNRLETDWIETTRNIDPAAASQGMPSFERGVDGILRRVQ